MGSSSYAWAQGCCGSSCWTPADGFHLAEPWAACRPGFSAVTSAKSERSLDAEDVFATEGAVFS